MNNYFINMLLLKNIKNTSKYDFYKDLSKYDDKILLLGFSNLIYNYNLDNFQPKGNLTEKTNIIANIWAYLELAYKQGYRVSIKK